MLIVSGIKNIIPNLFGQRLAVASVLVGIFFIILSLTSYLLNKNEKMRFDKKVKKLKNNSIKEKN